MSIHITIDTVTPAKALAYLETMDGNRPVRQQKVDYYAAQMGAGLWRTTHQGIAFDDRGRLVDGQHRLWAIVQSGASVKELRYDSPRGQEATRARRRHETAQAIKTQAAALP